MKKVLMFLAFAATVAAMSMVTGCDEGFPTKLNHGGNQQPYTPANGQYRSYN